MSCIGPKIARGLPGTQSLQMRESISNTVLLGGKQTLRSFVAKRTRVASAEASNLAEVDRREEHQYNYRYTVEHLGGY